MRLSAIVIGATVLLGPAVAQPLAKSEDADNVPPMTLRTRIPLPGVYGRIDHYGWDSKRGILIVSALGNNTVEIIDQWKRVHSIPGLEHPQGSIYLPEVDRIAVSSQSGKLRFYDAASYALLKTIDFGAGANTDNLRYDATAKLLYIGFGEGNRGALAMVNPATMERLQEYRVGSHPESFQLETNGSRIFVNLPDQESLAIIDRKSAAVTKWQVPRNTNSHTLALDEANGRLFTAALQPGRFAVVDAENGKVVADLPCVLGVHDLWFDTTRKRIYASGSGAIDVFRQENPDRYSLLARVPVGNGSGSTSFYLKTRTQDGLFMSWPNMLPKGGSEVLLFYVND